MVDPRTSDPNAWKPVNVTLIRKRIFEDVTQLRIMKWGRLPWVIQLCSKCHQKCPDKGEAERDDPHRRGEAL